MDFGNLIFCYGVCSWYMSVPEFGFLSFQLAHGYSRRSAVRSTSILHDLYLGLGIDGHLVWSDVKYESF